MEPGQRRAEGPGTGVRSDQVAAGVVLPPLSASMTFDHAARTVLAFLRDYAPMGLWSVTRLENGRQTFLYLEDAEYGVPEGGSAPWAGSFCISMTAGRGPRMAPDVSAVPLYRDAPIARLLPIGAYAGVPLLEPDGALFGTLCGISATARDEGFREQQPLLEVVAALLGIVLAADRGRDAALLAASVAVEQADTDALTGLLNRRGWDRRIAQEQLRFARYADPTVVVMVDLDRLKDVNDEHGHAAGDAHIRAAGQALRGAVRTSDPVARLGGDEFCILLQGCTEDAAESRVAALGDALRRIDVESCVGWEPVSALAGFPAALDAADRAMYAAKRRRGSQTVAV